MKKLYLAVALAGMLTLGGAVFAQDVQDAQPSPQEHANAQNGEHRGMMSPDAMLDHMSTELNLTEDQKTKIKPILEEQSKKMSDLRSDTSLSREDRRAKMKDIHESTMSQLRPILNADQQKKLEEMMSRRPERNGKHHPEGAQGGTPQ
ncbi:MAG TPA: hypothetical protein VFQ00_06050 [Terriglobales bacterium]|nr:hypothetical protein [Terriglobales bacterium]